MNGVKLFSSNLSPGIYIINVDNSKMVSPANTAFINFHPLYFCQASYFYSFFYNITCLAEMGNSMKFIDKYQDFQFLTMNLRTISNFKIGNIYFSVIESY